MFLQTPIVPDYSPTEKEHLLSIGGTEIPSGYISVKGKLVIPSAQSLQLVSDIHNSLHIGPKAFFRLLEPLFWPSKLFDAIQEVHKRCLICSKTSPQVNLSHCPGPWGRRHRDSHPFILPPFKDRSEDLEKVAGSLMTLQNQINSLAGVELQNQRALDLLTAEKGGTCMFLEEECCYFVNEIGIVQNNIRELKDKIRNRFQGMAGNYSPIAPGGGNPLSGPGFCQDP